MTLRIYLFLPRLHNSQELSIFNGKQVDKECTNVLIKTLQLLGEAPAIADLRAAKQDNLIFDPIAGGGVTADTCLALCRRCPRNVLMRELYRQCKRGGFSE